MGIVPGQSARFASSFSGTIIALSAKFFFVVGVCSGVLCFVYAGINFVRGLFKKPSNPES